MANESDFNPGEVVKLKSGGPRMTVINGNDGRGWAECTWFEGVTPKATKFLAATLERVKPFQTHTDDE